MNSLKDEVRFLLSGRGMPYEKVALMVAIVVSVIFTITLSNNVIKEAPINVIDLDNSKYSHEFIQSLNTSPYIKVTAVLNTAAEPTSLFYRDKCVAVVYLPQNFEKNHYSNTSANIGVFYDNTNTAQTGELKQALNKIIATENSSMFTSSGGIFLNDRNLFNPAGSSSNGEAQGFLFFFSAMFFVFATIGIIPRLRMEGKLQKTLMSGTPFGLMQHLIPYCGCLLTSLAVGMTIFRLAGDMVLSGNILLFLFTQLLYLAAIGMMSLLFGWTAANPGVAASRMILFVPAGFIFGGQTGPIPLYPDWVVTLSHFFPLTWEFQFVRDILMRGAAFTDISKLIGEFLIYLGCIAVFFCFYFYKTRRAMITEHTEFEQKESMEG